MNRISATNLSPGGMTITSTQFASEGGNSFTMQGDLNIIRKFCADGWCEDVCVVEQPGCEFPTRGISRFSALLPAGRTDS